jgi:hypothetical protein
MTKRLSNAKEKLRQGARFKPEEDVTPQVKLPKPRKAGEFLSPLAKRKTKLPKSVTGGV